MSRYNSLLKHHLYVSLDSALLREIFGSEAVSVIADRREISRSTGRPALNFPSEVHAAVFVAEAGEKIKTYWNMLFPDKPRTRSQFLGVRGTYAVHQGGSEGEEFVLYVFRAERATYKALYDDIIARQNVTRPAPDEGERIDFTRIDSILASIKAGEQKPARPYDLSRIDALLASLADKRQKP